MTCPRCTHEIYPQDALELIGGVTVHALQSCFDNVHGDLGIQVSAHAALMTTLGDLQQTAIIARTSEAQAIADMVDIQAQLDEVNALKVDNASKVAQITQLNAQIAALKQQLSSVQLELATQQSNILTFAKENTDLKAQIDVLKQPKP